MKKKYILLILLCLISYFCYKNKVVKHLEVDSIKYAVSIDGVSSNNFPSKGSYNVEISCEGANSSWNYEDWVAEIYDVTDNVLCNLSFTTKTTTYLNDYIISLSGKTQGTGQVVNENGYRFEGKNPNNYVKFNNELWRIIGVFDSASHGILNTNLTKIIRNDSIGGYVWDNLSTNNWGSSDLYTLLNNYYYNATNGTDSGNCYKNISVLGNCDYSVIGIQEEYRNIVKEVTWYLGGYSDPSVTVEAFYGYERSSTVYSGNDITITAPIGLMYPSDFGYSVLSSNCGRTATLTNYNTSSCAGNSWLSKEANEWTITPISNGSSSGFNLYGGTGVKVWTATVNTSYSVRPVVYLNSSVYYISGDGSPTNPYIIGM